MRLTEPDTLKRPSAWRCWSKNWHSCKTGTGT